MIINHNMSSMNAHRQMIGNTNNAGKSMEKLSSGLRINRAGDDAAGLAISEKMRSQIRGLDQATRNSQDGISLIQTAEGALNETHSILQRMRELAVQASNDTNNTSDRGQLQKEMNQLSSEINRIGNTTEFNTMTLLDGKKSDQHIVSSTTEQKVYFTAGTESIYTAVGITDGASSLDLATGISFASGTGNGFSWNDLSAASQNSVIEIGRNATGELVVTVSATASGGQFFRASDVMAPTWDSNNQFTYNQNGITFKISKSDFDDASTANKKQVDLWLATNQPAGALTDMSGVTIDTQNSWVTNGAQAKIGSGITLDPTKVASGIPSAATTVRINFASGATGTGIGTFTVSYRDSGGATLMTDSVSAVGTSAISYNNMGVSFNLTAAVSQASATLDFDLGDYRASAAITTNTTKDDSLSFQVGANTAQGISVAIDDARSLALGLTSTTAKAGYTADKTVTNGTNNTSVEYAIDITTAANATANITTIQNAIEKVSDARAKLGAYQNRLEHTIANLGTSSENLQAAESRIRDVDMAKEMSTFSKNNILAQAAQAMLAQANQQPQQVLQLLR